MGAPPSVSTIAGAGYGAHRPLALWKYLVFLGLGTIALLAYISLQRDIRLKRYSLEQANWYAAALTEKLGDSRSLPLNLEVVVPPEADRQMFDMVWLSREDARVLRHSSKPVIVGRSIHPFRRLLTPDGWMVVTFYNGCFTGQWMTRAEFEQAISEQKEELQRLASVPAPTTP